MGVSMPYAPVVGGAVSAGLNVPNLRVAKRDICLVESVGGAPVLICECEVLPGDYGGDFAEDGWVEDFPYDLAQKLANDSTRSL